MQTLTLFFWGVILTKETPIVMLCHDGDLKDLKRQGLAAEEKDMNPSGLAYSGGAVSNQME